MGVLAVHATDARLWWTAAELDPEGSGFSRVQLFTVTLPLPDAPGALPLGGTHVADLNPDTGGSRASDTHFVYNTRVPTEREDLVTVVALDGSTLEVTIPNGDSRISSLDHFGPDGVHPHTLWMQTPRTTYRMQIPTTPFPP